MVNQEHKELIAARAHLGDKISYWNPKMFPYIFAEKNGRHIIDITKTSRMLDEACAYVESASKSGKTILFIGTKPQAASVIAVEATRCNSYYINYRWLGGMLTNWETIQVRINRLQELETKEKSGVLDTLPKKELSKLRKELSKLRKYLNGIKNMPNVPDIVVVIDPVLEMTAIREAIVLNIPIISLVDTNGNPDILDFPIPCNDDSILTISLILRKLSDKILLGQGTQVNTIEST
jgi:small subunit ribosomal protein S2|tara:strand:- start:3978 stop:4685 length:708 start_codon:yes stop_codon:yes gene_type:complete